MKPYYAPIRKIGNVPQTLYSHLTEAAAITKILADKLDLGQVGELLGLMHDFGKYSQAFQEYIKATTGVNPDVDVEDTLPNGKKIDHSTAGAQWVYARLKKLVVPCALKLRLISYQHLKISCLRVTE